MALAVVALAVWGLSKLKPEAAPAPTPAPAPEVKAESEENPDLRAEIPQELGAYTRC